MTNIDEVSAHVQRRLVRACATTTPSLQRAAARCLTLLAATMVGCGGGGGGVGTGGTGGSAATPASSEFSGKCAPDNALARDGSGNLMSPYISGALEDEKAWVRSYMGEAYLWYREIPAVDTALGPYNVSPAQLALDNWFEALKTPALIPSGARKDEFSFTLPTAQWNALSQSGVVGGYGVEWVLGSPTPPRSLRVAYVEARSQAAAAGVARGDAVLSVAVDGVDIDFVNTTNPAEIAKLNEALFSPVQARQTTFRLRNNAGSERSVALTASQFATTPVKDARVLDTSGSKVGYLLFNDFILPAEGQLKEAIQGFRDANVRDLILDLRYNGGGYLFLASQLAYMIAPTGKTANKTFEKSLYSDKRAAATNSPSNNMQFLAASSGVAGTNTTASSPLPNLGLDRVYVLTTSGTCSASESVINGLRGVDVEVIVLGASTCGKPYGFTAKGNCGLSYFPVEFQGVNQKGFGDFADGFAPTCAVRDDLENPLGSENEGLLAAALAYRAGGSCAAIASAGATLKDTAPAAEPGPGAPGAPATVVRPASRSNKYLLP